MSLFREMRGVPVVVVGGAGFLGSHLVAHLVEGRRCEVMVIDNLVTGRRGFVHPKARFVHADVTVSESYLERCFRGHAVASDAGGPLYVFNYAAEPYVPLSFERPGHVFATNATGALNVINAAEAAGAAGILQVSSAEIYGEGPGRKTLASAGHQLSNLVDDRTAEDAPVVPHSSYGASKAAIDFMVQARWREAGTPCVALRQFNCLGERETHPYVVPEIIGQLAAFRQDERHAREYGHGSATVRLGNDSFRDFLYAGDQATMAAELLERCVQSRRFGEVYNLGSEGGTKVYDLARTIGKLMGFAEVRVEPDEARKRPWEIWHLQSDNSKLYEVIEARPTVGLEEALRRTIAWYEGNGRRWPWEG